MFRIIGQYELSRDGDLIQVRSTPEFNLEAARQYALDMNALIEQMPAKFGVLVEFEAPPVIAPEVEESMRKSAWERAQRGMVAVAFVAASPDGLAVARGQWERIYEGSGVTFRIFHEPAPARDWLHDEIARRAGARP
jgi:hypothetical protein